MSEKEVSPETTEQAAQKLAQIEKDATAAGRLAVEPEDVLVLTPQEIIRKNSDKYPKSLDGFKGYQGTI